MIKGLENIADKEYLGRLIILGKDGTKKNDVIVYALTGRSEPSRARVIKDEKGTIKTSVTDMDQLKKGNPKLLIYNCIRRFHDTFAISNGAQTDIIYNTIKKLWNDKLSPTENLIKSFDKPYFIEGNNEGEFIDLSTYEPDKPNFTPRINGIITRDGAALSLVKCIDGLEVKQFFEVPLIPKKGFCLSTYQGKNVTHNQSIPSFEGEPFPVRLYGDDPEQVAKDVYEALGPKKQGKGIVSPGEDFRVSVVTIFYNRESNKIRKHIINRNSV